MSLRSGCRTGVLITAFLAAIVLTGHFFSPLPAVSRPGINILVDSDSTRSLFALPLDDLVEALLTKRLETSTGIKIEYPLDGSLFPPEIVPSPFFWRDSREESDVWLIELSLRQGEEPVYIITQGKRPPPSIDPECEVEAGGYREGEVLTGTNYWKPDPDLWSLMKERSVDHPIALRIYGFNRDDPARILSQAQLTMRTSRDPVGAPIFYRDVPLMPSLTKDGTIKPLSPDAIPLVKLRLRDISESKSNVALENPFTCVNCHSFSRDGKTMGMDVDGPDGDKGAYGLAPVEQEVSFTQDRIISWNSFREKIPDHKTIGLFSQVSPDGQHVVSTVNESVFVANYRDFRFLQSFFPTGGILAVYSRQTGEMNALPGATDPSYVHTNANWSPDGRYLVFSRARSRKAYRSSTRPQRANDPAETQIQYDLYRIPFNNGSGGVAVPLRGASRNGKSNSFPKYSPDGKWIVYVQAENGQLLRPDSELYIIPGEGGKARRLSCNTPLMNSWHSWSPNGKWLVFSSKWLTPFTQMFLTHIDENGNSTPPILVPEATADNRAVNIPEFVNFGADDLKQIEIPAMSYALYARDGIQKARMKQYAEAIKEYETALRLEPHYPMVHYNLGTLYLELRKFEEARTHLEKVIELESNNSLAHNNLGAVYFELGEYARARQHFSQAIRVAPLFAEAYRNLGELEVLQGNVAEAEALLRKALLCYEELDNTVASEVAWTAVRLGNLLVDDGKLDEAEVYYRKTVLLTPEHPVAYYNLAQIFSRKGKKDQAFTMYRETLVRDPEFAEAHFDLAGLLKQRGQFKEAVEHYSRVAEIRKERFAPALRELAWLLATCPEDAVRDGAQAVQLAEQLCRATGCNRPSILDTLAAAYAEAARFDEAVKTAERALHLSKVKGQKELENEIQRRLKAYHQKKAWRDL